MPQLQAISKSQHAKYRWLPYTDYRFAAEDNFAPLALNEFQRAAIVAPIVFILRADTYYPVLMQGLLPGKNLLTGPKGKWLGSYVPAHYRSHPFCLAKNDERKNVFCFDGDSEFVKDTAELGVLSKPFFYEGEVSPELAEILIFLEQLQASRIKTQEVVAMYQDLELIKPWVMQAKLGDEHKSIKGLYRIDDERLGDLSAESLKKLMESGALAAAYCQLLSLQQLPRLEKLFTRETNLTSAAVEGEPEEVFTPSGSDDSVSLDWL
jgi:hypothetical protein